MADVQWTLSDCVRELAVMVQVHGPDPKGRKMRHHAFYSAESGDTTLSASGVLLRQFPEMTAAVLTCASIVEPFLSSREEHNTLQLIRGAELKVLVQSCDLLKPSWLSAKLTALVDVPRASEALKGLLDVQRGGTDGMWEIGWNLAQVDGSPQLHTLGGGDRTSENESVWTGRKKEIAPEGLVKTTSSVAAESTRIAVLKLESSPQILARHKLTLTTSCQTGDALTAIGSPFGALSPLHFFNSISMGVISNSWPPSSGPFSLLMADIRCLPGMEGGPVFSTSAELVGLLLRPLRQRGSGAEVQLVLTAQCLTGALEDAGISFDHKAGLLSSSRNYIAASPCVNRYVSIAVEQALAAVVLVTVGEGAWASGIILNGSGLILTNAHLLEPWRFGRSKASVRSPAAGPRAHSQHHCQQHVRVRVDSDKSQPWYRAHVLFVSQGPVDVALLQIDGLPSNQALNPICIESEEPVPGSTAVVIGHGIFGPRSALRPSITAGVVSKVVKAGEGPYDKPIMLQTTAAVHPGGSGGVVVNSAGCMIGLVTSNARHNGGTVIPHLNFSATCATLQPVFAFASSKENYDLSLLEELNKTNDALALVWALVPAAPPKTAPLPFLGDGPETGAKKGSQFAKFIADNQAQLAFRPPGLHARL